MLLDASSAKKNPFGHKAHPLHWEPGVLTNRLTYFRPALNLTLQHHARETITATEFTWASSTIPPDICSSFSTHCYLDSKQKKIRKLQTLFNHGILGHRLKRPKAETISSYTNSDALTHGTITHFTSGGLLFYDLSFSVGASN